MLPGLSRRRLEFPKTKIRYSVLRLDFRRVASIEFSPAFQEPGESRERGPGMYRLA